MQQIATDDFKMKCLPHRNNSSLLRAAPKIQEGQLASWLKHMPNTVRTVRARSRLVHIPLPPLSVHPAANGCLRKAWVTVR